MVLKVVEKGVHRDVAIKEGEVYNVHDAETFYINFSIIRFFCCLVVSLTHLSDMKELLALYVKLLNN